MSNKVPQIRFNGFTDDWEERKLGEFTTSFSGGTPSAGNSSYYQGDIPFIRSGEINSDKTELFLTEAGLKNSSAKMVSVGDILYALYGATSGEVGISQINGAINQAILAIKPSSGYSSEFIMQWLKLQKQKIIDKYLQGGQGNLSGSIVKNLVLNVPDFEEQQQIGSLFKQIDDTIALHQRKLDLLKEQKKGYLQKMFPKNGAKVPELRFAGFTGDWEERKLGDVVGEIQSGNRLPKDSLTSGNIPYVVAQTKNEGVFKTISKKTLDYNGNPMKLFPGNSISFSIDNPEAMFYRSTEFYTSNIMRVIHADYLSHQQYLFILENMKSFTRRYDWSHKFSGPVVSNLEYLQPNEQEQCKIGSFILAFDNIITLHQRKLDLLKEQKKGFLQKMFV